MKEPKIRFKGFTGEWETKKLASVTSVRGGYAFQSTLFDKQQGIPVIRISNILSNGIVGGEYVYYPALINDANITLSDNDIVIAMSGATTGKIARVHISNGVLYQNQRVGLFTKTNKVDYDYLYTLLTRPRFSEMLNRLLTSSAQPNASSSGIESIKMSFPISIEEQRIVGNFVLGINSLIHSTTKKIKSLKQVKAASLQSMFPQDGETTPRVRFKGFEGEWKPRKLDDICDFLKGKGLSKEKLVVNGKYGCILYGEIFTKYNFEVNMPLSKTDCFEGTLSKAGDLIMPGSTTTFGIDLAKAVHVPYDNVLYGGDIIVLRQKKEDSYDSFFLATQISCIKREQVATVAQGITIVHLHASNVAELYYSFPSPEEQKAIGTYFRNLDSQISLLSQQLEKLQQIKSACLDNMFV